MKNKKAIFYILIALAYISIIAAVYWECLYYINSEDKLRHEYRIGAAMIMTFCSPVLLGVSIMALFRIKSLTRKELLISFIPVGIIVLLVLSWGA